MIELNVKTGAVMNAREHDPVIVKGSPFPRQTSGYIRGWLPPRYPVPSPLGTVDLQAYPGIVCINTVDGDNWVYAWDQWNHVDVT